MELRELLDLAAPVVGILSGLSGVVFGIMQRRDKIAERKRAEQAEQATARLAAELSAAREELARGGRAQERLADLGGWGLADAQEEARRERQREASSRTVARRQEQEQRAHNRKMQNEAKKQTRIDEAKLRELKRQGRKKG